MTALQLDVKLPGLPLPLLTAALAPALDARREIIGALEAALEAHEGRLPEAARPQVGSVEIDRELVPRLVGLQVRWRGF